MNDLRLFLPCAGGVEALLADEVRRITGIEPQAARGGVTLAAPWREVLRLNLWSRLAQRVLIELSHAPYRHEQDLYELAREVPWELWFGTRQTFRIDLTAQRSPLKSLNFAALRIKDALVDRFRDREGERPSVDTGWPDVRVHAHLDATHLSLSIDTSGEPLFKRGWREDKGDAPLKETLAAAMLAACGWDPDGDQPLYDPCCGSGTVVIEAAQLALHLAPGLQRRFGFERLRLHEAPLWQRLRSEAQAAVRPAPAAGQLRVFGSDVAHRMVDFAQRNAVRAGVAAALELRGGDALQRMPPTDRAGVMLLNPPYGERIEVGGVAGARSAARTLPTTPSAQVMTGAQRRSGTLGLPGRGGEPRVMREQAVTEGGDDFFLRLAAHWKSHFGGWTAWVLSPDARLPGRMRMAESRRVPMWNGPIECRLFRFDIQARRTPAAESDGSDGPAP